MLCIACGAHIAGAIDDTGMLETMERLSAHGLRPIYMTAYVAVKHCPCLPAAEAKRFMAYIASAS